MQRIALAKRPIGAPRRNDFRLERIEIPILGNNEVLIEIEYMSLDPYMRGRMDDAKSYTAPVPVGGTMEGGAVGRVIASNSSKFAIGDYAFGQLGWASHGYAPASALRKFDPSLMPITTALGVWHARIYRLVRIKITWPAKERRNARRCSRHWTRGHDGRANRQRTRAVRGRDCRRK